MVSPEPPEGPTPGEAPPPGEAKLPPAPEPEGPGTPTLRESRVAVLRDHFRPPLGTQRHWHAFHSAWAPAIAAGLNERLPEGYFAEPTVEFGIEIDVATFE